MMNANNRYMQVLSLLFLFQDVTASDIKQLHQSSASYKKTADYRRLNPFIQNTLTLQQESLDALHLVGMLRQGSKIWALIALSDGSVKRVKVGDRMGLENAVIKEIQMDRIEIQKIVKNKQGLFKKSMFMYLRS